MNRLYVGSFMFREDTPTTATLFTLPAMATGEGETVEECRQDAYEIMKHAVITAAMGLHGCDAPLLVQWELVDATEVWQQATSEALRALVERAVEGDRE